MRACSQEVKLQALALAPAAQAWLARTRSAQVLHVFQKACNLINGRDEVLSLVTPEIGPEPFAVVVSTPGGEVGFTRWVRAGDTAHTRAGVLSVGALVIDTRGARPWQPRPPWERLRAQREALKAQLPMLRAFLISDAPPGSFAPLVTGAEAGPERSDTLQGRALAAARVPAGTLCRGISTHNPETCRSAARALAGLGGGLTPSGDDFIVGALYALWAARPQARLRPLAETILHSALPRTSHLSAAWLRAAARGEAAQYWHTLLEAILASRRPLLAASARQLLSVGHTSGADALAGFVCALELL